jgi:predicted RNase H-like nuclease
MSMRSQHRGAQLPYQLLAGVVPTPKGWFAATAKLQGITLSPEVPQKFATLLDIFDYKPAFQIIALFAPIGLLDEPTPGGRQCDRDARKLLGWPRSGAIVSPPIRPAVGHETYAEAAAVNGGALSIVSWQLAKKVGEVDEDVAPYWQRTVYEVHPELSFYQLNGDKPVQFSKRTEAGAHERMDLLTAKLQGVARVFDTALPGTTLAHRIDAAACLWTARRIASRAVSRLPEDPVWDSLGLRMELLR